MMIQPTIIDWLQWFFLVIAVGFFIYVYGKMLNRPYARYLFRAFLIKVFGGLAFASVYIYYYQFGDTFRYYYDIVRMNNIFSSDFTSYLQLMFTNDVSSAGVSLYHTAQQMSFSNETEGWFMVRLSSPFGLITGNSYLGITFWMSLLSLAGGWQLFKLSNYLLNDRYRWSFAIAFLVPSTIFWGSGLLKDTYTLLAVSVWALAFYKLLHGHGTRVFQIVLLLVSSYVLYMLKAYILISMLPWFFISLYLLFSRKVNSTVLKIISVPLLFSIVIGGAIYVSSTIVESSKKYNAETLEARAGGFQSWHKTLGGSYYDLGEIEYTPTGIVSAAPKSLAVTLFRPFPWEIRNLFMAMSSMEGLLFLVLVAIALFRMRLRFFSRIYHSTYLFGALFFCIIFGVAVGMNSYNFGALARYKLPMLSLFFLLILYVINSHREQSEKAAGETA